jgi:hypothetical protein
MKVTKAKCLNTDLARHFFGKSSRLGFTERRGPFPRGLARRFAASYFLGLKSASVDCEDSRPSDFTDLVARTTPK